MIARCRLPPGTLAGLWRDEDRYTKSYCRRSTVLPHRRLRPIDEDGYVFVLGRSDDVINVAGHRLSSGSMEAVVAVASRGRECAR